MQIIKEDDINEDDYEDGDYVDEDEEDDEDEDGIDKISAAIFIIKMQFSLDGGLQYIAISKEP